MLDDYLSNLTPFLGLCLVDHKQTNFHPLEHFYTNAEITN